MGMSTHVVAFKPPGEKWRQMKAVWDACAAAGVTPPDVVYRYFEDDEPDPAGVEIDQDALVSAGALRKWHDERNANSGFELDVAKLPQDVTVVRFYNGW